MLFIIIFPEFMSLKGTLSGTTNITLASLSFKKFVFNFIPFGKSIVFF